MDLDVIKSYLVSLGFTVDQPELNKFNQALRNIAVQVERVTTGTPFGMVSLFAKAGVAVTGVLATIAAGTVGLMDHVAQSDLGFQLYARRMFMTTNAAKTLKIATDALGVSLEDIVWGPKELQERFGTLTADQGRMQGGLGGDFEQQMRMIRDVRFEFTRLEVELQYLSMGVVKSLSKALFGDEGSLLKQLRGFNEWFQGHLPEISDEIANRLAPILRDMGHILKDLWEIASQIPVRKIADDLVYMADKLKDLVNFIARSPILQRIIFGAVAGGAVGSVIPGLGTLGGAGIGAVMGGLGAGGTGSDSKAAIQAMIRSAAIKMGLDPAIALAIAERETNFDQSVKGKAGEIGVFQLMPNTAKMMGVDPNDLGQNIQGGIGYLLKLYAQYHDWQKAITAYNGSGPAARSYADDVMRNRIPRYHTDAYRTHQVGTTIGSVHINITQPDATKEEIQAAVMRGIEAKTNRQDSLNMTQLSGMYA